MLSLFTTSGTPPYAVMHTDSPWKNSSILVVYIPMAKASPEQGSTHMST